MQMQSKSYFESFTRQTLMWNYLVTVSLYSLRENLYRDSNFCPLLFVFCRNLRSYYSPFFCIQNVALQTIYNHKIFITFISCCKRHFLRRKKKQEWKFHKSFNNSRIRCSKSWMVDLYSRFCRIRLPTISAIMIR